MEGDERETKRSPPDKDEDLTEEYGYTVFEQIHTLMQRHECPKSGDGDKAQLGLTSSSTAIGTFSATTSGMSSSTVIRTSTSTVSQTSHSMIQSSSSTESQSSFSAVSHVSPLTIQSSSSAESQIYSTKSQTSLTRSQTPSENENQMSTAVSIIKQENLSSPVPADEQNWVPSFCNREEMSKVVLQALDCSMIVLSTDGVIFYITENITAVLGYLSSEVMGRKLLSFLPDEEKNEVYRNICLKPPLSESVGSHVEFCCHLKREMPTQGECPIYEYVKFVLTLRDICSKSFVFFGGFVPSGLCLESSAMKFSMEDRFLLVGSVCAINSEILKELCTMKQSRKSETNQDSDKEDSLMIYRSLQGITPGMSPAASSFDTCNVDPGLWEGSQEWKPTEQEKIAQVKFEQYGPEIIVRVKPEKSSSSSETSVSTSEDIPDSLTTTFHAFTYESSMDARRCQDPVDMEFVVDSSYLRESEDTMHWGEPVVQEAPLEPMVHKVKMEPVVPEELMEPVVQEDRPSSGVATRRRTQVQPATLSHVLSRPDLWPMKETSRKQSPGKVKRSPSDGRDTKRFCTASQLGMFPERLEDFSDTFIQYLQELEPQIQQQEEEPKMTQQEELQVQEQEEEPKMTQQEELQLQQQEEEPKMTQQEELQIQQQEEEPKMGQQEELQVQQQEEEPKMGQQEELQIQQQEEEPKMMQQEELQVQEQEEEPKMTQQEELQLQQQEEEPKMTQQEELQIQQQEEEPKMGKQEELQVQQQEEEPKMGQQEELQVQQQEKPKMGQQEELQVQQQEEEPKMTQQEELQLQQQEKPKMGQQEELQVQQQEEEPKMTQQEELQLQQQEKPKMGQQEELQVQQQEEEPKMTQQEELQLQQQEKPKMGQQEELQVQQQEEEPKMGKQEELQVQQQEKPKMGQQEELQVQQQEEEPKMGQQEELQLQQQEKPKMPQREEPQMLQKQVPEEEQRQEQQLQQQQVQSRVSPLQMRAEQQPSSSIRDKDSKDQGEGSPSIHPEEQQGACMVAATSSGNSSESVSTPLSKSPIPPSDCTKGFIQVWLESSNSQDVFLELDTWSASDQSSGD